MITLLTQELGIVSICTMHMRLLLLATLLMGLLSASAAIQDYFFGDRFLARAIQDIRLSPWEELMETVTAIGKGLPMVVLAFGIFSWFLWKKQKAEYIVLGAALLSLAVNPVLKFLVDRPRPTDASTADRRYPTS